MEALVGFRYVVSKGLVGLVTLPPHNFKRIVLTIGNSTNSTNSTNQ